LEGFLTDNLHDDTAGVHAATLLEIQNYLSYTLLRDTDVMSMAHGLEVRVPLLDRTLVEYVLGLPVDLRFALGKQKGLLADAMPEIAAHGIKPKKGFTLPFERWLIGPLRERVGRRLSELAYAGEWIRPVSVRVLWRRFLGGERRLWSRVWTLYVMDLWLENAAREYAPSSKDL
jgi:asparagine synthase (glutamine-hydrolysing)